MESNINAIISNLKNKVKTASNEVLEQVSKDITRSAQINFYKAVREVPADDPNVVVRRTKISDHSYTIDCVGNQVLFIEFGAGRHEYTRTRTVGIVDEKETEIAPRPAGITHIGGYGQHKGHDDYWFYNSVSGRESDNNRYVRTSKAGLQAMITIGIRPHRALWRARNVALKKLYRRLGKL